MTRKTMVELQAELALLLPDNNAGEISPADVRTVIGDLIDSLTPAYAVLDISVPLLLPTIAQNYLAIPFQTAMVVQQPEFSANTSAGVITRTQGIATTQMLVQLSVEFSSSSQLDFEIFVNSIASGFVSRVQGNGNGRPVTVSLIGLTYQAGPATFELRVRGESGTTSAIITAAKFLCSAVPVRTA
jgi:hypothetical protein